MDTIENIQHGVIHITPSSVPRKYGVIIQFDQKKKVHFELEIISITAWDDGNFIFELDRKQVYIDNKSPDLLIDRLADELGSYLYPVQIKVDIQGYIKDIQNHGELVQGWDQNKYKPKRYYAGSIAERIIENMDHAIRSKQRVLSALKQDWFLSVFFSGIYGLKPMDFKQTTPIYLPMVAYGPGVRFAISRAITEQHTASKSLVITCNGILDEERRVKEIAEGHILSPDAAQGSASGSVQLIYRLYHKDFSVRSIRCDSHLVLGEQSEKKVRVEIYHLPELDKPISGRSAGLKIERP